MGQFQNIFQIFRSPKFPFKFVYSDAYWMTDLHDHVFPLEKYRLIYERLLRMGAKMENFFQPQSASEEDVLLVHTPKYWKKLISGRLSSSEMLTLELPFSPEVLEFALLTVGGTVSAAELALNDGLSVHIGGGFHHAFSDHGEGFCVLNDAAVAVEKLKKAHLIDKAMIVDCDVHQGNGTAAIFAKKDYVFTFSIHQMDLYPADKPRSSLDVELWSGDGDGPYLRALHEHFPNIYNEFQPDIVLYLAGADVYERDQLGGLDVTKEGLVERDTIVISGARSLKIPLVVVFAGGYAPEVRDTVDVHMNTIRAALKFQRKYRK